MHDSAIGVFDSGLGGLTAAKVLEEELPYENIIYFGDSGRMPYGGKSREELGRLAAGNAGFLCSMGAKAVLAACGTVSANAMDILSRECPVPCFGVIDAACETAAGMTRSGRVGLIATPACVGSGAFDRVMHRLAPDIELISLACPEFAAMVEHGHFRPGDPIAEKAVRETLRPLLGSGIDLLILGCTHYPLLGDIIGDFLGRDIIQISAGAEAARALVRHLRSSGQLSGSGTPGKRLWYTSGDRKLFSSCAGIFLGHEVDALEHIIK